jgi:hypothetical protein
MNINRHNYEAFFLLYVDKELSAAERRAVDVFVMENPDLQIELTLLQQTIVKADDVVMGKKEWLYMAEDISALQENLLLYADGELTTTDKSSVEAILETDKKALAEWNILQQARLQPDVDIVFTDKQSLYRKEAGGFVGFKWWRAAAAAILLGFGLWAGLSVYKNYIKIKAGTGELVNERKEKPAIIDTDLRLTSETKTALKEKSAGDNIVSTTVLKDNSPASNNTKTIVEKTSDDKAVTIEKNEALPGSVNKNPKNNLPKPYFENINNKAGNETIATNVLPENSNSKNVSGNIFAVVKSNPKETKTNTVIANINPANTDPNITAIQVAVKTTADGENNNRYLNVDDTKEKRTALGGFLRKAKRVLERTTNVKTGDGIKIAGFEIALK